MYTSPAAVRPRQYYLDWLRVLSIFLVFVYHASRVFGGEQFHINNVRSYSGVDIFTSVLVIWGMPLLFLVAGASAYLSLGKTAPGRYMKDRVLRLLVPFSAGLLTHIPIQVYLERVNHGEFTGSLAAFLPHYFDGFYGFGGNFAWMGLHLWFLVMLFLYTLLALPILVWLARGRGVAVLDRVAGFLARSGAIYLLALPVVLLAVALDPEALGISVFGSWNVFIYMVYFLYGAILVAHDGLRQSIERQRWVALAVALVFLAAGTILWFTRFNQVYPAYNTADYVLLNSVRALCSWFGLLAIWGFSIHHLNFGTAALYLANEAVLPFYVLHQTVLVIVGFYVIQWPAPDLLKFAVIFAGSLIIIVGLYWFLIRPYNVMRFLFGMRPKKAIEPAPVSPSAEIVGH
jgi:surface polysaccharide O-acyltransferase-like enzyme